MNAPQPLPPQFAHLKRYSSPVAERAVSARLGLPWDSHMQDWDLVNANPNLLPTLVRLFADNALSDDERFSAMTLAVACYDEALVCSTSADAEWLSLREELLTRPELYVSIVWDWFAPHLAKDESFPVSATMALIWEQVSATLRARRDDAS
jgi:hypothetical protein